jgi:hypothetical protein
MSDARQQRRGEPPRPSSTDQGESSRQSLQAQVHKQPQAPIRSIEEPTPDSSRSAPSNAQLSNSPAPSSLFRVPQSPRTAPVGGESSQKPAKVAIPRLKRSNDGGGEDPSRAGGRHRVNHACEPCRHRKTKCSGERPVCRHCQDFKITCFYADGKRDRVKK